MTDAEKQAWKIRQAANALAGVASACQRVNSDAFMQSLVDRLNRLMVAMGDAERYEVKGNGIETVWQTPG